MTARPLRAGECDLVVIAASTGGPHALETVAAALPGRLRAPIMVVQHMPQGFTTRFAERLDSVCALRVSEAADGDVALPGRMLIAPGGWHMRVGANLRVTLDDGPEVHNCRPSADVLFSSAALACPRRTLAVVLTGMGRDGADGARDVHASGGVVMVQDETTSVVWGMPGAVVADGTEAVVVPLQDIASHIVEIVGVRP